MKSPKGQARPGRLRAAVLGMLGGVPRSALTDPEFWAQFGLRSAGQEVNEQTMLSLSAVWACARLISETISTLPLGLYVRGVGGRLEASDHQLYGVIHDRPNADSTASVFWEAMVAAMMLRGNAFAEKLMLGGRLVGLKFLVPDRLGIDRGVDGRRRYWYTEDGGRRREIPESRIFRIPGFTTNGEWGLSVVRYGAGVFGSALAAQTAANSTFEKGLASQIVFTLDKTVKPEQRDDFRRSLEKISGAVNAGQSPLLEMGMGVETIGINPRDAQLLESRAFSIEEICRWFRVWPGLIGHAGVGQTMWGTGVEQMMIGFLTFTLRPWLRRIEQAIWKDLLTPGEQPRYYAEFAVEGLLRGDSAARAAFYSSGLQNGWINRAKVAAMENLPSMPGGEIYTVQSNLVPLDQLGNQSAEASARAALRQWLGLDQPDQSKPPQE